MSPPRSIPLSRRLSRRLSEPIQLEDIDIVGDISLYRAPMKTLCLFAEVVTAQTAVAWRWVRTWALLPACTYACLRMAARHLGWQAYGVLAQVEHLAWFTTWWLGLGVLSSIGLGSGLHSGILFLFPHIAKVCRSAETCGHLHFDSTRNIWFAMGAVELFPCDADGVSGPLSLAPLMAKTVVANIIWGVGTALGEVPPYLVARAAAMRTAGRRKSQRVAAQTRDTKVAEFVAEQTGSDEGGMFNRIQTWMVYVLQRHGFWALVLLASIPNPAFDLCGMCCGTFGMALPSFLGGVLMGKGIIKPLWQCAIFTIIFHVQTRAVFVERVGGVLDLVLPPSAQAKRWLHDALAALSAPASSLGSKPAGMLTRLWAAFLICVVLYFSATCIEQIALDHALSVAHVKETLPSGKKATPLAKSTPRSGVQLSRQRSVHLE